MNEGSLDNSGVNQTLTNPESALHVTAETSVNPSTVQNNSPPLVLTADLFKTLIDNSSRDAMMGQYHVGLVESIKAIPVFTGEDPYFTFAQFKEKFEDTALFFKWSEEVKFYAVQQRLAGKAQQTYHYFKHQVKTCQEVLDILAERFSPRKHPSEIFSNFWEFKQPPNMTVAEYLAQARLRVREVTKLQNLPEGARKETEEGWLLAMLLKNIDCRIRRNLISRNPVTVAELETIALNEEKAILATEPPNSSPLLNPFADEFVATATSSPCPVPQKDEVGDLKNMFWSMKNQMDVLTSKISELALGKLEGNFCHAGRNVTSTSENVSNCMQVVCHKCGLVGHIQRYCTTSWAQNPHRNSSQNYNANRGNQRGRVNYNNSRGSFRNGGDRGNYRGNNNRGRSNFSRRTNHNSNDQTSNVNNTSNNVENISNANSENASNLN